VIDQAIDELTPVVGVKAACAAVGRPRASHYRHHRKSPRPPRPERVPKGQPRALGDIERKEVLAVLHADEHVDEAPATIYAKLLDQGIYLASTSTMYRILRDNDEVRERRRQATHPPAKKPELLATRPNEVFSWDITKLAGPQKWTSYYLLVTWNHAAGFNGPPCVPRAERSVTSCRLARRRSGRSSAGTSARRSGCGSGRISDERRGRSMPTREGSSSICRFVSGTASTRSRPAGRRSPRSSAS
jgi:hypothetical protein